MALLLAAFEWSRATRDTTQERERLLCIQHMQRLGQELRGFAKQHGGDFPPRLYTQLAEDFPLPVELFYCPANSIRPPPSYDFVFKRGERIPAYSQFVYVGAGHKLIDSPNTVLLYEAMPMHSSGWLFQTPHDGHNVLFLDGSVHTLSNSDFMALHLP